MLGYNARSWSATVSVWLRLNPDQDLEPGYCDPIQIVGNDSKKGWLITGAVMAGLVAGLVIAIVQNND